MANNGIVSKSSKHSVDETLAKLQAILKAKEVPVFALIEHSGEAKRWEWKCIRPSFSSSVTQRGALP